VVNAETVKNGGAWSYMAAKRVLAFAVSWRPAIPMQYVEMACSAIAATKTLRIHVHLAAVLDVSEWRRQYQNGLVPDVTPYGFHHAESMGCQVTHSECRRRSLTQRVLNKLLGFDILHAWRNRAKIAAADIVWTMTENEYLAVLGLRYLAPGMARPKLIAQSVWLFDVWDRLTWPRRFLLVRLLRHADVLTVHSEQYLPVIKRVLPGADVRLLPFGISLDSFPQPRAAPQRRRPPLRILSLGNDLSRDWPTLLAAFGNDPLFELVVITCRLPAEVLTRYRNLRVPRSPSMPEFRSYYHWADFVVIAMTENRYAGITVALEAVAMGAPVISSATGGVPSYFAPGEVIYVAPGDPKALRVAALNCSSDCQREVVARASRRFVQCGYSTKDMARRYVELSRELVGTNKGSCTAAATASNKTRSR
jgi:glycosyltransferase involved in cell wall biosynthesis